MPVPPRRTYPPPVSDGGARLLVVDPDPMLRDVLADALRFAGYAVRAAADGPAALAEAATGGLDLVVLDVDLPGPDGFEVAGQLRDRHPGLAVLFLSARGGTDDLRRGFAAGGDDFVAKPFRLEELRLRIAAVLRRTCAGPPVWSCADLVLDDDRHEVTRGDRPLELTPTEFRLLRHLLRHAGSVVGRPELLAAVWDYPYGDAVIDTAIWQLRRKVDAEGPRLIHTVRGYGYALRAP